MATNYVMQRDTAGWRLQVWLSFGLAIAAAAIEGSSASTIATTAQRNTLIDSSHSARPRTSGSGVRPVGRTAPCAPVTRSAP